MNPLCVEKIQLGAGLLPRHGVLAGAVLGMIDSARCAADAIEERARSDAASTLSAAQARADALVLEAEQSTLRRAHLLIEQLEQRYDNFLAGANELVLDIALALFARLANEMAPRERVAAVLARLEQEAPRSLMQAVLYVCPEDAGLLPELAWEVRHDASLACGICRLEASEGVWCIDFDASVAALEQAFRAASLNSLPLAVAGEQP